MARVVKESQKRARRRKSCRHVCRQRIHRKEVTLGEGGVVILPCCMFCDHCKRRTRIIFTEMAHHLMDCHKRWWERRHILAEEGRDEKQPPEKSAAKG